MVVRRCLLTLLFLYPGALVHAGVTQDRFAQELATVREEVYVMPGEALRKLEGLKEGHTGQELGHVLVEMSRAYYRLGDERKAIDTAVQAEQLGRTLHDDVLLAKAMLGHGYVLSSLVHDQETARKLIQQAAQLAHSTQDAHLETRALVFQGLLAEGDGRSADALEFATRAAAFARFGKDPDALSMALREQARLLACQGEYQEALTVTDELLGIAQASGMPAQLAHARLSEYAIAAMAGRTRHAEKALQAAVDLLRELNARESLVVPLSNLAELYIQARRFGEAARTSEAALKISREIGDKKGSKLATFRLGITDIYLRQIAAGRKMVDDALVSLEQDDKYVRMLLDYGHALSQVGEGGSALTIYEKAGAVSLAAWRKERQLSYQALQRAYDNQKKQNELTALHHESALKAAELQNERRLKAVWALLSATTLAAAFLIAMLYRRVARANKSLHVKNEQLFLQSTRDSLTGLFNRHYFYEEVVPSYLGKLEQPARERRAVPDNNAGGVFLLLDIDRFKSINDRYGHGAGDTVLKSVAARLGTALREQDVLIRWGGEEFLAYLPGAATDEARQICARLLAAVSATPIAADGQQLTVTVSIGFCPTPLTPDEMDQDWEKLVHLADLCLYHAKTEGRNQTFGIGDGKALTPKAIAAADADLKQASIDGLIELLNVHNACTALSSAEALQAT
jgi:diguanylate cyclase (GGDEF)-like protein